MFAAHVTTVGCLTLTRFYRCEKLELYSEIKGIKISKQKWIRETSCRPRKKKKKHFNEIPQDAEPWVTAHWNHGVFPFTNTWPGLQLSPKQQYCHLFITTVTYTWISTELLSSLCAHPRTRRAVLAAVTIVIVEIYFVVILTSAVVK